MKRIRGAVKAEREYHKLVRLVALLERQPQLTDRDVENIRAGRKAIAEYEALPAHLR